MPSSNQNQELVEHGKWINHKHAHHVHGQSAPKTWYMQLKLQKGLDPPVVVAIRL